LLLLLLSLLFLVRDSKHLDCFERFCVAIVYRLLRLLANFAMISLLLCWVDTGENLSIVTPVIIIVFLRGQRLERTTIGHLKFCQ